MTKLITTLPLLIFLISLPGINNDKTSGSDKNVTQSGGGAVVELILVERSPKRLKFQVRINNSGERAVLIVSNPVRVDGDRGAYLSLNEHNPDLLEVAFAVYEPPIYTIYAPKHRVRFLRLGPGETHVEDVVLDEPFKDTKPPWGEWNDTKRIHIVNVREVVAKVGVLPDEPAVHASLVNVASPHGLERITSGPLKGKALFEVQTLVSSNVVKL
jgi:hypothetical protein